MFKIDKSSVDFIDSNKEFVVIKQWLKDNVGDFEQPESGREQERPIAEVMDLEAARAERAQKIERTDQADRNEQSEQTKKTELIEHANEQAEEILAGARHAAELLLEQARQQVDQIRDQVRREVVDQEVCKAEAVCEEIKEENTAKLNAVLRKLFDQQARYETVMDQRLLQLSLEVAQKILNIELEKNDTVFEGLVRQALQKVNIKGECTLKLNAREYQRHFSDGGKWVAQELDTPYNVVMDNSVPPGGCVLELQDCVVRVGVDAQIKKIAMALNQG